MKFALIRHHASCVDYERTNVPEQILDVLHDDTMVSFIDFTQDNMYQNIYENLCESTQFLKLTFLNIFDTKYDVYVGCFMDAFDQENDVATQSHPVNLNRLCSQITSYNVVGDMAIVKMELSYKISDNNISSNAKPVNISQSDLDNVITGIFIKNGVVINTNDTLTPYKYIVNPLEPLITTDPLYAKKYRFHDFEFYNNIIQVVVSINNPEERINEAASWICERIVRGRVYIGMYKKPDFDEDPPFISLSPACVLKIVALRKKSSQSGKIFSKSPETYANFEMLIDSDLEKHKDSPDRNLDNLMQEPLNNVE